MGEKILKVKNAVVDLIDNYPDVSGINVYINKEDNEVTIAVEVLAKLRNEDEKNDN